MTTYDSRSHCTVLSPDDPLLSPLEPAQLEYNKPEWSRDVSVQVEEEGVRGMDEEVTEVGGGEGGGRGGEEGEGGGGEA